jgi:hypothetical protein
MEPQYKAITTELQTKASALDLDLSFTKSELQRCKDVLEAGVPRPTFAAFARVCFPVGNLDTTRSQLQLAPASELRCSIAEQQLHSIAEQHFTLLLFSSFSCGASIVKV